MAKASDGMIRVGGVGTGRIFQWAHLNPYLRLLDRARLTTFYDVQIERAEQARDKYEGLLRQFAQDHPGHAAVEENLADLRVCRSLDELLERVDLIDICTTTRGRMEAALAALARGVHSMGEKPMARTWLIADRAVRAFAQRPEVFFQLNDDNVFDPTYLMLRDLLAKGVVGQVQSVWLIRGSKPDATSVLKSQADGQSNGGGCLMDYGSHGMAGVLSVLGRDFRPVKVEAVSIDVLLRHRVLQGAPCVMEVDDNARFKVLLENAATGGWATIYMEATWCGGHIGPKELRGDAGGGGFLRIEGDEGLIDAGRKGMIRIARWDGGETLIPLREYPGEIISFNNEIETMVECIRRKRKPEVDVAFGAEVIAICDAAYYSALCGRAVTLDEFKQFCRGYVEKLGDNQKAEGALLQDLLKPYAYGGAS